MKQKLTFILVLFCIIGPSCQAPESQGKHVFILSGQSNMANLNVPKYFTPIVEDKYGKEKIIVIKNAVGGQAIRRWYKDWKPPSGNSPKANPNFYNILIDRVLSKIKDQEIASITFIWMQGESDAFEKFSSVYKESLIGVYNQLSKDLQSDKINFVIGRLNDKHMNSPDWVNIRDIQVEVANSQKKISWINTDDLNDFIDSTSVKIRDGLHLTQKGYDKMGERFAQESIKLIKRSRKKWWHF